MTVEINDQKVTATASADGTITVKYGKQVLTFPVAAATSVVTATLAARKDAYDGARKARETDRAAAKAKRESAAKDRKAAKAKRDADQVEKLKKRLADIQAKLAA